MKTFNLFLILIFLVYPSFEDLMKDLLNKQISSCVQKTLKIQYNESKSLAQSSQKAIIQTRTSSQRIFSSSELRVSTTKNLWANSNSDIEVNWWKYCFSFQSPFYLFIFLLATLLLLILCFILFLKKCCLSTAKVIDFLICFKNFRTEPSLTVSIFCSM